MRDCYQKGRMKNLTNRFNESNEPINKKYTNEEINKVFEIIRQNPNRSIISICRELNINYQTIKDARRKSKRCYKNIN